MPDGPEETTTQPPAVTSSRQELEARARELRGDHAALIEELLDPVGGISRAAERALLGTNYTEIGFNPDDLDLKKMQHRLIECLFHDSERQVQDGLRDEYRTRALMDLLLNLIGKRILAVLAQKEQVVEDRVEEESLWRIFWLDSPNKRELGEIEKVSKNLRARVDALRTELKESFWLDDDVPEEIKQFKEMEETLKSLDVNLVNTIRYYHDLKKSVNLNVREEEYEDSRRRSDLIQATIDTLIPYMGQNAILNQILGKAELQPMRVYGSDQHSAVRYEIEEYIPRALAHYQQLQIYVNRLLEQISNATKQYETKRMADYLRSLEALKIEPRPAREAVARQL